MLKIHQVKLYGVPYYRIESKLFFDEIIDGEKYRTFCITPWINENEFKVVCYCYNELSFIPSCGLITSCDKCYKHHDLNWDYNFVFENRHLSQKDLIDKLKDHYKEENIRLYMDVC